MVAQAIDYASWVKKLDAAAIADIYKKFNADYLPSPKTLDQAFFDKFGNKLDEDDLNNSHQIVVVSAELDSSTERIIRYLSDSNVPVNAVFFHVFRDSEARYLSRVWFIEPAETQEHATAPKSTEPWNGEYYVSFGHDMGRSWDDARKEVYFQCWLMKA